MLPSEFQAFEYHGQNSKPHLAQEGMRLNFFDFGRPAFTPPNNEPPMMQGINTLFQDYDGGTQLPLEFDFARKPSDLLASFERWATKKRAVCLIGGGDCSRI
jgi:hypothetical protein